jgi:hypothetical protein
MRIAMKESVAKPIRNTNGMKDSENTTANGMGIATVATRIATSDLSPAVTRTAMIARTGADLETGAMLGMTMTTGTAGTRTESTTANTS